MTNPNFTTAIAQTRRSELHHEANQHRLVAELGRESLWSRLLARRSDRRSTAAARSATAAASSSQVA